MDLGDTTAWRVGEHALFEGKRGDVAHDGIGNGYDGLGRAIVTTELIVSNTRDALVKTENKVHRGPTPGVDVLGVVADDGHGPMGSTVCRGSKETL